MSLQPGQMLGHFRLGEKIGQGGMGEVFEAEDTRLKRSVAIKILPSAMAADHERLDRFQREAQVVAALNHPNIVTIFSVEEAEGLSFIAMEKIEGQTLDRLVPREGLPLGRLFDIAVPLADAVNAAHEKGVTHRDLKPGNVMVSAEGRVKVLDFGLAKLRHEIAATEETSLPTQDVTEDGIVLGTVPYMSPEQVQGKPVEPRSDIFSLGIMLYEMCTGRRPFSGETSAHVISAILRDTPDSVTDLNREMPRHLARIIRRCLQKDPRRRYQTALDLRNELEELQREIASGEVQPVSVSMAPVRGVAPRRWWPLVVLVPALVVVVSLVVMFWPRAPVDTPSTLETSFAQLTQQPGQELRPTLSPDGKFVAYMSKASGNWDILLQRIGGRNPINLTEGSTEDDGSPKFSPDGERIAFRSERQGGGIFVMGATGESARRVTEGGFDPAWSPDGTRIVHATEGTAQNPYARNTVSQLWVTEVATGETELLYAGDAVQPDWSPGGHRIAYWGLQGDSGQRDLWTVNADGTDPVPVTDDADLDWNPVWSPDGSWLYFSSDRGGSLNLWRIPIDEMTGQALGAPEPVTTPSLWSGELSFSREGDMLAFTALDHRQRIQKVAIDPATGAVRGAPEDVTRGTALVGTASVSPDGEWLAYRSLGRQEDIFVVRADGTEVRQLTNDPHKDRSPQWSPDGSRIVFYSDRGGRYEFWTIRPDGSGLEQMTETTGRALWYPIYSPDGRRIAGHNEAGTRIFEITGALPVRESTSLPPLGADRFFSSWSWSPDGTRIAGSAVARNAFYPAGTIVYTLASGEYETVSNVGQGIDGGWGGQPVWFPDGRRMVVGHGRDLYLIESGGESGVLLAAAPEETLATVGVSRDGVTLFFERSTSEADIWLVTLE